MNSQSGSKKETIWRVCVGNLAQLAQIYGSALESSENRIVIREHRKERIKHYVSRDEDVSNRPTMTFAWHQSGIFQIIYSHKLVATELASPWTGFTVCEWGLSPGVPRVALGER